MNTREFVLKFKEADVKTLAFHGSKYPDVDFTYALDQIKGWQTARQKLPTYATITDIQYPHHLSMEQCSSELTARYKAKLVSASADRGSFIDLTAGFGIDFSFIAPLFHQSTYVEQQAYLCELAHHNFPLLGLGKAQIVNANCLDYLGQMDSVDWIFLDPARRDKNGGKVVAIHDCEPDVEALEETLLKKGKHIMIKLSPMLDISLALNTLKHISQVHVIAVNGECKELLLILEREIIPHDRVRVNTINIQKEEQEFSFSMEEEEHAICEYAKPEGYLYEPNAAVIKAGGFKSLCARYAVKKLHPNSHLYVSDAFIPDFPGRSFLIDSVFGFSKKELKELQSLKQANLTVRNFPQGVFELRKRLKLSDGGNHYLFATTLLSNEKVLILGHKPLKS